MHVTVAVRLERELVRIVVFHRQTCIVIHQARHLFLLHERDLIARRAKVIVAFEQIERQRVRVLRRHDRQRNLRGRFRLRAATAEAPAPTRVRRTLRTLRAFLHRQDILHVQLQIARVRRPLHRQRDLDPRVPQSLSQPPRDEHEARLRRLPHPNLLQNLVRRRSVLHRLPRGHARRPSLERILPLLRRPQQLARVRHVLRHPPRVPAIGLPHPLDERALPLVVHARRRPIRDQMRLSQRDRFAQRPRVVRRQRAARDVRVDDGRRARARVVHRGHRARRRPSSRGVGARARVIHFRHVWVNSPKISDTYG